MRGSSVHLPIAMACAAALLCGATPALACEGDDPGMKVLIAGGKAVNVYRPNQILCAGTVVVLAEGDLLVLRADNGRHWLEGPRTFKVENVRREDSISLWELARRFLTSLWGRDNESIAVTGGVRFY